MPEDQRNLLEDSEDLGAACQKALAETSKALKAFSFYPDNHPLRSQILTSAYEALANLVRRGPVTLIVQRGGFAIAGRKDAIENNPMTKALAQELFARELQRLTFLPELSPADLSALLSALAVSPQKIAEDGGVAGMLSRNGISAVIVNQIDVSAVYTKKSAGQAEEEEGDGGAEVPEERPLEPSPAQGSVAGEGAEPGVDELLAALAAETDDERYRQLARLLLKKALPLKLEGNFDRLYVVLARLLEQQADPARSTVCRDVAHTVLQQLILGEMAEHLLNHLEDVDFPDKEAICRMLRLGGAEVVDAVVRRLTATGSRGARKALGTALVRIGVQAQPQLLTLLKDGRVQVVQMAVAILAEIGNRDAVKGLVLTAYHPEGRVRMESIRALARIGGMEATGVLLSLVQEGDEPTALHAISWLGTCRNQAALEPLLRLVARRDLRGKLQALQLEALRAVGHIGDRRALAALFKVVRRRCLLGTTRRREQKLVALEAIAALGGEQARAFLQGYASGNGELAGPAAAALQTMAQKETGHE
ncbi:HEAT repeat domain-containing protein [Geomonas nitrogeniifigens]|uniref:HEAT repeat domain-containing protein n=1 Tax=Geomonas diazotrophica TaxID=2843197 RepID=A0ABX8JL39_9BACT|nr:HEAT repeat domain-containing protein [Geomonas nitrogeniifigens]QWV98369.1 HEAT repeat domain-containing protein [Geomonas nitrogeniifigens]QXE87551.1 HEAT repeat domain-containing protein [Geomonas nitrogeniifigens]